MSFSARAPRSNTLTGTDVAAIWSAVLGRAIQYGGDDSAGFEKNLLKFMPSWMAYDMRLMSERFLTDGMTLEAGDVERLTTLLGGRCARTATSPPKVRLRSDRQPPRPH